MQGTVKHKANVAANGQPTQGDDADTTGCVVGGLAGILYQEKDIPSEWIDQLVKTENIRELAVKVFEKANKVG